VRIGLTARLDTLKAAVLLAKLEIFNDELERRAAAAHRYDALLAGHVITPALRPGHRSAWAQYTIRSARRAELRDALQSAGIPTRIYYPVPLHRQPAHVQPRCSLPEAERAAAEAATFDRLG